MNYYNDNDKGAVKWIKYLIKNKLIPDGEVDDRSIKDIEPGDLNGFKQCHFFAGIGGWSYALQLAAWPPDRPVWTGSCPCQPFSVSGKGLGEKDDRHLWPYFRQLIKESNPDIVFGEQVASKLGREWLAGVQIDLERMGFVFGAADIPACSVGAPHIRQRLWWVADAKYTERRQKTAARNNDYRQNTRREKTAGGFIPCGAVDKGLANPNRINGDRAGFNPGDDSREQQKKKKIQGFKDIRVADTTGERQHRPAGMPEQDRRGELETGGGMGNAEVEGSQERKRIGRTISEETNPGQRRASIISGNNNMWRECRTADCRDGKQRRIPQAESAFPVVAHGISGRVATLRGIGNSIVPQVAAEFIKAFMDYEQQTKNNGPHAPGGSKSHGAGNQDRAHGKMPSWAALPSSGGAGDIQPDL